MENISIINSGDDKMKILRMKMRMTQKQLAERIGVSQAYISKIENGHVNNLTIDKIDKLSHALMIPPTEMFEKLLNMRK